MPSQVQFRRGTTEQNNSFTGAAGEVSIDINKDALRIHDGVVAGGFEQAKADLTNISGATNLSLSGITTTNSLSIGSTQVISSARQLQNIASLDATTTATIESAVSAAPNDFTSLNISGVSTFSGITTHTTSLFGTQASFSGVVTATSFVGALTGTASNVTTNANLTGHVTSVGNAAVLGSFTSLQLLTALTDETGSGANVFATSPTLVTPELGTPSSGTLTNCTFPTLNQNTTGSSASCTGNATTATTANAVNTANSYQVAALGIGQAAGSGTEFDLAGRYAQTSIAVAELNIDCSLGNYYTKTISSSSTFTFSNIPASRSYSFTLCVTHDSGTITWPGSVKWPQNTAPVLTTYRNHKFMFSTYNGGSVWYGAALPNYSY